MNTIQRIVKSLKTTEALLGIETGLTYYDKKTGMPSLKTTEALLGIETYRFYW